jgi:hypothetical protein
MKDGWLRPSITIVRGLDLDSVQRNSSEGRKTGHLSPASLEDLLRRILSPPFTRARQAFPKIALAVATLELAAARRRFRRLARSSNDINGRQWDFPNGRANAISCASVLATSFLS